MLRRKVFFPGGSEVASSSALFSSSSFLLLRRRLEADGADVAFARPSDEGGIERVDDAHVGVEPKERPAAEPVESVVDSHQLELRVRVEALAGRARGAVVVAGTQVLHDGRVDPRLR